MDLILYSLNQLNEVQKARENSFYTFIFSRMIHPSNTSNQIYYSRFLKSQFNAFPVASGYPIISKFCPHQSCYFYVQIQQAKDLDHNFFRLVNKQIGNLKCKCGVVIRNADDFVFDSSLAGLLQLKLTQQELETLHTVEITKNHQIYVPKRGVFHEVINTARLKAISAVSSDLKTMRKTQQNRQTETKTLKVDTYSIMHELQEEISNSDLFTGRKMPPEDLLAREQDKFSVVLPICTVRDGKNYAHLYKQTRSGQAFSFLPLLSESQLQEKFLQHYDSSSYIYYFLSVKGSIYACDLRYMYNFLKNGYQMQKLCELEGFDIEQAAKEHSALVIKNRIIYIFCGKQTSTFVQVLKGKLPRQPLQEKVTLERILDEKVRNRRGYSVAWIRNNTLIPEECLIIYGGVIQKTRNFKLMEIIILNGEQPEKYLFYKINISEDEFQQVSYCHPTLAIFAGRLVLIGGIDNSTNRHNHSIVFVPLKEGKISSKPIFPTEIKKQEQVHFTSPGATHVGEGWMVFLRGIGRQMQPLAVHIRRLQDSLQIEVIRNN